MPTVLDSCFSDDWDRDDDDDADVPLDDDDSDILDMDPK